MLKPRIVGVLIVKGCHVVQSIGFCRYLPVGTPEISVEYLNKWGIDEIVMLNIDAGYDGRRPDAELVARCSRYCQVPLTIGGGVRSTADMELLISAGADKITLNSAAISHPDLISQGARLYGSQAIVVSIDAICSKNKTYSVVTESASKMIDKTPAEMARIAQDYGAGEIFLNSVDRDGAKTGYDLELIRQVIEAVSIPVIVCGGVGRAEHFFEGIKAGASAVSAGNFFHFTEHSVILTKRYLVQKGLDIRLDTHTTYLESTLGEDARIGKPKEEYLANLRFVYIPEEII